MDPLKIAKFADVRTDHLVFGYIREVESDFDVPDITSLIIHLILGFYYQFEFITKFRKDCFEVSEDKLTIANIKAIGFSQHAIYFNHWIASTSKSVVQWTFKINKMAFGTIYFGLISREKDVETDFGDRDEKFVPNYAVNTHCGIFINGKWTTSTGDEWHINDGDIVTLILDFITDFMIKPETFK